CSSPSATIARRLAPTPGSVNTRGRAFATLAVLVSIGEQTLWDAELDEQRRIGAMLERIFVAIAAAIALATVFQAASQPARSVVRRAGARRDPARGSAPRTRAPPTPRASLRPRPICRRAARPFAASGAR